MKGECREVRSIGDVNSTLSVAVGREPPLFSYLQCKEKGGYKLRLGEIVTRATFFVQNKSRFPIHILAREKWDLRIMFPAGTVI